ncbi:hypothetical protein AAFF_G00389370 [Aldrovandia affinis]|uniref:Uncharacterized protein n=1 Tax=Aldrovandia affinis TaxID=143900 RepID=A0AAD7WLD5_9TELE|nr:hypothetical protein AAFF_G00389370 [Aldrovandia affinis]
MRPAAHEGQGQEIAPTRPELVPSCLLPSASFLLITKTEGDGEFPPLTSRQLLRPVRAVTPSQSRREP